MEEYLSKYDAKWQDGNIDSKIYTLRMDLEDTNNILTNTSSELATIKADMHSHSHNISHSLDNVNQTIVSLSLQIALLQLNAIGIITADEMMNLIKMLSSPDKENHVVAEETIKNLCNKVLK